MNQRRPLTFKKTRAEHLAEAAEDYTELVLDLITERGEARVTELARRLGISHVTALRTVKRLTLAGLFSTSKRSPITLTASGRKLALQARRKHQTLVTFLERLGVPKHTAENDAEGIEHHVSKATMKAILRWMKKASIFILFLAVGLDNHPASAQERCALVKRLAPIVSRIRQLPIREPILCRELPIEDFRAFKANQLLSATAPAMLEREELIYKLLGLIPESYPYARCIAHSNSADVLATYDADSRTILLPGSMAVPTEIIAHEITHALQDQHYHLQPLQNAANQKTDSALALAALCEGDALRVQEAFRLEERSDNTSDSTSSETEKTSARDECALPDLLDRQNGFPYERGMRFVQLLTEQRGEQALTQAFKHPPRTTHEILTPAAYPIAPQSGRRTSQSGDESLGEFTIFLLLRERLSLNRAILAAKGWRDDQVRINLEQGAETLEWTLHWASPVDAADFFRSYNSVLAQRFSSALDGGTSRFEMSPREDLTISGTLGNSVVRYFFRKGRLQ